MFKDLITERIKKSESDTKSRGAYMNIDFGNNEVGTEYDFQWETQIVTPIQLSLYFYRKTDI